MTPFIIAGVPNPLSRITIASLDELGYDVDYDQADAYPASLLDPSCSCNRRLNEGPHFSNIGKKRRTEAQEAATLVAIEYGKECLRKKATPGGVVMEKGWISVIYLDPVSGDAVSVIITEDDL